MIYLGCSGWFYNHWIGRFYPEDLHKGKWLEFYSRYFNTVEVNSTFYHFPSKRLLLGWYKRTPKDFVFTLKANRGITHETPFADPKLIKSFYILSDVLKEKLGCILFQFPPSKRFDPKLLKSFLDKLSKEKKNVIEFRHKSWYTQQAYEILKDRGIGYCIVSAPRLPTHLQVTSENVYIRWHGKKNWYADEYTYEELKEWAEVIEGLGNNKDIYGYFNNDYNCFAVKNCMELKRIIRNSLRGD